MDTQLDTPPIGSLPKARNLLVILESIPFSIKILGASLGALAALVGVLLVIIAFLQGEVSNEEIRLRHLEQTVQLLEAYRRRYGAYPQPTERTETVAGFRHIWGYRPSRPALASCTLPSVAGGMPDLQGAVCGGNVYDAGGKIIGWKGTITVESALNSVEAALKQVPVRLSAPLAEFTNEHPIDPLYAMNPALAEAGFGEYIYAVRAPEDGALGKGGVQYQLATTVPDPVSGDLRTVIRGNYFVRTEERNTLPPSLIGPGLLFDAQGNKMEINERPIHVLLDGQQEGHPNPILGEGKRTIRRLMLRRRVSSLVEVVESRLSVLHHLFPQTDAPHDVPKRLSQSQEELREILEGIGDEGGESKKGEWNELSEEDLSRFESDVVRIATDVEDALFSFIRQKDTEVREAFRLQVENRRDVTPIFSGSLIHARNARTFVLLARDELVKYLDGEGIEEQSRSRAGRKLQSAVEEIPDVASIFAERNLALSQPFLSQELQEKVSGLAAEESKIAKTLPAMQKTNQRLTLRELYDPTVHPIPSDGDTPQSAKMISAFVTGTGSAVSTETGSDLSGGEGALGATGAFVVPVETRRLPKNAVMVTTVLYEIDTFFSDLELIISEIQADIRNPGISIQKIDGSLRSLDRSLTTEIARIDALLQSIADEETTGLLLKNYEQWKTPPPSDSGEPLDRMEEARSITDAIRRAAEFAGQHGDFSQLIFSHGALDVVVLEKQPGVPDTSGYDSVYEAQYQGIPYPLLGYKRVEMVL